MSIEDIEIEPKKSGNGTTRLSKIEKLFEWDAFVELIAIDLPQVQQVSVRRLWKTLTSTFGRKLTLPRVQKSTTGPLSWNGVGNSDVRFSWSKTGCYLDASINSDGLAEWFCSIEGEPPQGNKENREELPISTIVEIVSKHLLS